MKRLIHVLVLVAVLAGMFWRPIPVAACSCIIPGTPAQEFARSSHVFSGRVTQINHPSSGGPVRNFLAAFYRTFFSSSSSGFLEVAVQVDVAQSWKGVSEERVEVYTGTGGGDCGFGFASGRDYLIFANEYEGRLFTSICSLTKELPAATDELAFLAGEATLPLAAVPSSSGWSFAAGLLVGVVIAAAFVVWRLRRRRRRVANF